MLKLKALCAGLLVAFVQAGCGGGGGGGDGGGTRPPSQPPSVDGSAKLLAEVSNNSCSGLSCLPVTALFLDASGEYTAFWGRIEANGDQSLHVANGTSSALQSSAVVEGDARLGLVAVHEVSAGRFLAFQDGGDERPDTAREVVTADAGTASVSAASDIAPMFPLQPVVRDFDGNLSAIVNGTTAPFPSVLLPGNINLALVTPQAPPQVNVQWLSYADENSLSPRALMVYTGRETVGGPVGVYVGSINLVDGTIITTVKISQQDVIDDSSCPISPTVKATGAGERVVSWRQLDASGRCSLYVNGRKMNSDGSSVGHYAVTGGPLGVVSAVWGESSGFGTGGVRWRARDTLGQWTDAASISSAYADVVARSEAAGSGPGNTLTITWFLYDHCDAQSCTIGQHLVSKFVNGTWTTRSIDMDLIVESMAINAAGQAAALGYRTPNCGAGFCTELSVFSF
jgi:hypothetical protein